MARASKTPFNNSMTRKLALGGWVLAVAVLVPWSIGRGQQPEEAVETVTEAENVPRTVEQGPSDPQPLPPKSVVEANAAADLHAPARVLDRNMLQRPAHQMRSRRGPLERRTQAGSSERAYLGVQLNPQFAEAAIVSRVHPNSPAAAIGLRAGDRIWGINNQRVESTDDLLLIMANLAPDEEIEVHFDRPHSLPVKLSRGASGSPPETP